MLNRLKELAQRQNDLNERLKELQSALEAAKTAQAREEIEKQLKRLRDQQQQILRDTDELRERMEREENRERMADARQQIEQSREHVRQASEALEEGRVPQAVTERRAGRPGAERPPRGDSQGFLRPFHRGDDRDARPGAEAGRGSEETHGTARRLERSAHSIRSATPESASRSREGLGQQGKQLDQLLDRMRRTVQDAEETEPLLAKELFDTVRKANEQKIADDLKVAEQLVDAGNRRGGRQIVPTRR